MKGKSNPVAKHARTFNKAQTMRDRKKDAKRGYQKHKGKPLMASTDGDSAHTNSAAKKPVKYRKPDGTVGVKMVSHERDVETESTKFSTYSKMLDESTKGLAKKADKSGISVATLRKVYNRGVAAWKTGHRPGTTPQQWGMARVNAFIVKKKRGGLNHDKDLA